MYHKVNATHISLVFFFQNPFKQHVYSCKSIESDWLKIVSDFLMGLKKDVNIVYNAFYCQDLKEFNNEEMRYVYDNGIRQHASRKFHH